MFNYRVRKENLGNRLVEAVWVAFIDWDFWEVRLHILALVSLN